MNSEITLDKNLIMDDKEEKGLLVDLEEKIEELLMKYQEIRKERDHLFNELRMEREKVSQLEKKLEFITQDREKVKIRIDQLLNRLNNIDI
jgi:chromosome segregation ATPase